MHTETPRSTLAIRSEEVDTGAGKLAHQSRSTQVAGGTDTPAEVLTDQDQVPSANHFGDIKKLLQKSKYKIQNSENIIGLRNIT